MAVADVTIKNLEQNENQSLALDSLVSDTSKGTFWLGKIFGLQEDEIMRLKERDKEADRKGRLEDDGGKGGGGPDGAGKGGKFGKMLKGLFSIFSGLFKGIGKFALLLLKPLVWLAKLPLMLTSVVALWAGLAAVVLLFAGVGIASMSMSQKDFDILKENIAGGVAKVIAKIVEGAMTMWNNFVPDSWKISEDDKKKMTTGTFTTVKDTIIKIIDFAKDITDAFGEGFTTSMDGIKTKFESFTSKIGAVFEKISGWVSASGIMGAGKTGLMWYINLMGDALGKFVSGVLSVANFLADMILDPTVTMAKAQVSIEDAFNSMGRNIADFLDNIFNMESLMKMIRGVLGKDSKIFGIVEGFMGTVEDHAAGRRKEMEDDKKRLEGKSAMLAASAKETDRQLKAQLALGDERDDEKVRNLQLALSREQSEVERNKAGIKRINDNIRASEEIIVQEKVDEKMGEEARKQERSNEKLRDQIGGIERREKQLTTRGITADVSGPNETITAKGWESMLAAVQKTMGSGVTAEQLASGDVQLSVEAINEILRNNSDFARTNLNNIEDQSIMFKTGLALQKEMTGNQLKLEEKKVKLAETDSALAKKREGFEKTVRSQVSTLEEVLDTEGQSLDPKQYVKKKEEGGFIGMSPFATGTIGKTMGLESGGLFTLTSGEFVLDNQAAQTFLQAAMLLRGQDLSGTKLMDLQRESFTSQQSKGGMVNIVNNSPQQINQNQSVIIPSSSIQPGNSEAPRLLN